jgi:hypothetical protein
MRRWGALAALYMMVLPAAAWAQADVSASADEPAAAAPAPNVVYGALPGGVHAASADALPKGVAEVSTLSGFGYRKGLLGTNERFGRLIGDLAAAFGVTENLSIGLSLDGRYDRHYGGMPSPDDGYVGDPHLNIRFGKPVGKNAFGAQLGLWVPGKNAPSIAASATSVDFRGLASIAAGSARLNLSAGFRLDNSASSIDDLSKLSLQDRVSLGASNYNAVLAGAQLVIPTGKAWIGLESTIEAYIGGPAATPDKTNGAALAEGSLLIRGGAVAGVRFNDQWSGLAFLEAAKSPGITATQVLNASIPIIPYEPIITFGLGLQASFGGPHHVGPAPERPCWELPAGCKPDERPIFGDVTGTVTDGEGKPMVGAKVTLKGHVYAEGGPAPVITDDKGAYRVTSVKIGRRISTPSKTGPVTDEKVDETSIDVAVELADKKPGAATIQGLKAGDNAVPPIKLEPLLPPGQLKILVRDLKTGKPITGGTVTIQGTGKTFKSGEDGIGQLDLAPGTYKISVAAPGYKAQDLDVTIEPNGVVFKNSDLSK